MDDMGIVIGVAVLVAALCASLLVIVRQRSAASRQIDALTSRIRGDLPLPSTGLDLALDRLAHAIDHQVDDLPEDRRQARQYRAALAAITLGVVLIDEEGTVIYRNPFAASFLEGRHGDALVGETIDEIAGRALEGESTDREVQIYGPPRRTLFVMANPIADGDHDLGAVVLIDDITEQERLDAIRRDFVANISHELKTPIGAVSLLAETMAEETDPEVVASLAGRISSESERLAHTIDDLLQLSRIEHGSDEDFGPVLLQSVVAAAQDRVRAAAEQRDVEIGVSMPERELLVWGDHIQLTSAVFNLLDNGVKYIGAEGGVVSVRARAVGEHIDVVVQDSGIGVPRKDLDRIFERFYRVDRARSRESGGTGLGLAIVRHVIANHGGRIGVESTEGEGTTFTLQIPAYNGASEALTDPGKTPELPSDDGNGDHEVSTP